MMWRILISLLLGVFYTLGRIVYSIAQGPTESKLAAGQLQDSAISYSLSRALATNQMLPTLLGWIVFILLAAIWLPFLVRKLKNSTVVTIAGLSILAMAISACGPPQLEVVKEIGPSETAFLVPLEGASKTDQGKFMSVEYLERAKVATKRVTIPTRKIDTGRGPGDYKWIETMALITVNRAPVTREWTKSPATGTSVRDQAISVESRESIDFFLGVTAQASIHEEDAAKFLYWFAGKTLDQVMDTNVRGFVQSALWREFGSRDLTQAKAEKREIMDAVQASAKNFFADRGLTIEYIGGSEGLTYKDPKIQEAINKAFISENDKKVALQEQLAQQTRNITKVQMETANRQAAEEFAKAKDAQVAKIRLEIEKIRAEAMKIAAEKWKGNVPERILPQGSGFLFGLDEGTNKDK